MCVCHICFAQVDLLACDVGGIKPTLASPQARANASISSAHAAVQAALQSAAAVAVLTARGDDVAASRAATAAARAAQVAVGHAQALQLDVTEAPSCQEAGEPSSSAAATAQQDPATAAAIALHCPTVMPAGSAAAVLQQQASAAADTGPARAASSTSSLQLAAANAQLAAQLAQGPQPALLPRGSGLLVLFSNDWSGKARLLQAGKASVADQTYSYYSVLQLMLAEGLLLRDGFTQPVKVRVAAEFLAPGAPKQQQQQQLTGSWSKTFKIGATPGAHLLLHSRPRHTWGKKFTAKCSAAAGYAALFPELSQANMAAALGEYGGYARFQRCFVCNNGSLLVIFIKSFEERQQVSVLGVTLKYLEQPG
jgi:hypothetical protein